MPTSVESRMTQQLTQIRECSTVAASRPATPSIVELSPHVAPPSESMQPVTSSSLVVPMVDSDPISWTAEELYDWLTRCDMCRNVAARLRDEVGLFLAEKSWLLSKKLLSAGWWASVYVAYTSRCAKFPRPQTGSGFEAVCSGETTKTVVLD